MNTRQLREEYMRLRRGITDLAERLYDFSEIKDEPRIPDKDAVLEELIKQIGRKTEAHAFYFLSSKRRAGPVVTVVIAQLRNKVYARGVGVCDRHDTPNRRDGKIAAAKVLLKAIKAKTCVANPTPDMGGAGDIFEDLVRAKLVTAVKRASGFIAGTTKCQLTKDERRIVKGFKPKLKSTPHTVIHYREIEVERETFESEKEAQEIAKAWRSVSPNDRIVICPARSR